MTYILPTWPPSDESIHEAVRESLASGDWGRYQSTAHLELVQRLQTMWGMGYVRLCASGTAAIEMSLRAVNVGPGDEVIVAAFDYPGNVRCIEAVGARPVLVEIADHTVSPAVEHVEAAAGDRVRAVILSHLFGQAADVVAIRKLCDCRGWSLIEDACQVPGMQIEVDAESRSAGSFGHVATLSFGGSNPLTSGNGGAILTSDARIAAKLKALFDRPSDAFGLSALQAAVLLPQLTTLRQQNQHRQQIAWQLVQWMQKETPRWQPLAQSQTYFQSCFYKLGFLAETALQRTQIVKYATQLGLPIGEGFRSLDRMSDKRCRKPMPLIRCQLLGERLCVVDHRLLLTPTAQLAQLTELLEYIARST